MHGGSIAARSEGLGKGSEFVVRLPVASEVAEAAGTPQLTPATPVATALRVLTVDDYQDALDSVSSLVEVLGHRVVPTHCGEDALRVVESERPDVVLLDIGLPGMDGYEVARRIRAMPGGEEILLVAMTGWGQQQDKQRATAAGFDLHFTKPADPSELKGILDHRARSMTS